MGPKEIQIWLLRSIVELAPGARPAAEALRRLGVSAAEADQLHRAVAERLAPRPEAPEAARTLGWHSLGAVEELLGPATLETASFRGVPHRLHAFDLPLWPGFRFCWGEIRALPGYAVPGPFRRRPVLGRAPAIKPWRTLFHEVRDRYGQPLREQSRDTWDELVYRRPDGEWVLTFAFDLLQAIERPR